MRAPTRHPYKWTFDAVVCHVKSKGYTTKREWYSDSASSYNTARTNEWVDAVCDECSLDTRHKRKWMSVDQVVELVTTKGYKTIAEWDAGDAASYRTAMDYGWVDTVMRECGIRRQHTEWQSVEQVIEIVKSRGFKTKAEWIRGHHKSYAAARLKGWLPQVTKACRLKPVCRKFTTIDDIVAVVRRSGYVTKADWFYADHGSYEAASRRNWLDDVCVRCGIPLKSPSYRPDRPHWVYVVLLNTDRGPFIGYGNSAVVKNRMKQHRTNAKKVGATVTLLKTYKFNDRGASMQVETALKSEFPQVDSGVEGFQIEATYVHNLASVKARISTLQKEHELHVA